MDDKKYLLNGPDYANWLEYSRYESSEFVHIWAHLKPWLNVDIGLDDDEYYKLNRHPLWIYFRNGYDDSADWLPLIITPKRCYIPLPSHKLNITYSDYHAVCEFGQTFHTYLKQLADGAISFIQFADIVRKHYTEKSERIISDVPNAFDQIEDKMNSELQGEEFQETGYMDLEEARQRLHAQIDKLEQISQSREEDCFKRISDMSLVPHFSKEIF